MTVPAVPAVHHPLNGTFDALLEEAVRIHGHLCAGQVLGVRMSLVGLREAGIGDPKGADRKNLIVFVEMDRCATDAVQSVTGCSLGKRTLKFLDYGKMAATFVNLRTGRAVRVLAREDAREKAGRHAPAAADKYRAQLEAYKFMADEELFDVREVSIELRPEDMPGRPLRRVACSACGEAVQDMREVRCDGQVLCRPCWEGGYVRSPGALVPAVMQKKHNGLEIRSKLWIERDGEPVFGRGRRLLLEAIDAHGSINRAAKEVGISFRKAWGHIKAMEERLGFPLVERTVGGRSGGGAVITKEAKEFLESFNQMEKGLRAMADDRFRRIFGGEHV
jgi:molybdate transport repressor ModE-like protein